MSMEGGRSDRIRPGALLGRHRRFVTWGDFLSAVNAIRTWRYQSAPDITHVAGIPRGGLPLAVALSHALAVPMVSCPCRARDDVLLIVNDIWDTGRTLRPYLGIEGIYVVSWFRRRSPASEDEPHFWASEAGSDWIVFPWEVSP